VPKNAYGTANAVVLPFPLYETVFVVLEIVIAYSFDKNISFFI
jgi:hypothetical protein